MELNDGIDEDYCAKLLETANKWAAHKGKTALLEWQELLAMVGVLL